MTSPHPILHVEHLVSEIVASWKTGSHLETRRMKSTLSDKRRYAEQRD